jgi:hypothetical protein
MMEGWKRRKEKEKGEGRKKEEGRRKKSTGSTVDRL